MHGLTGHSDYFDIIERTLYNGLISGLSLDGTHFFYPNALESDGVYLFNQGACTRKSWFDCSCCPTNVIRFIPAMPGLIYSKTENTVFVNLYVSNEASVALDNNTVHLTQQTNYPWDGKVYLAVRPEKEGEFTLKLRIPSWARNQVLPGDLYSYVAPAEEATKISINGQAYAAAGGQGYYEVTRKWKAGEKLSLEIELPMQVKKVATNPNVAENQGKVALEYGPLVFAVEAIDNPGNFDAIVVDKDDEFEVRKEKALLGGVNVLQNDKLKAIPYYAWSNRGVGRMKVWLDFGG